MRREREADCGIPEMNPIDRGRDKIFLFFLFVRVVLLFAAEIEAGQIVVPRAAVVLLLPLFAQEHESEKQHGARDAEYRGQPGMERARRYHQRDKNCG